MSEEHYFTASPATSAEVTKRRVQLRGHHYDVVTASGVFSSDRVDKGTAVFLDKVPSPSIGPGSLAVDVGCGWGPIALALAREARGAEVWAVDPNERARSLTAANASSAGLDVKVMTPEQALVALGERRVDLIWSNPPIRIGKEALHSLVRSWMDVLSPEGVAYMVVQKNLGADSLRSWMIAQGWGCEKIASSKGFRILAATREPRVAE